jgi:hypothetical protein
MYARHNRITVVIRFNEDTNKNNLYFARIPSKTLMNFTSDRA